MIRNKMDKESAERPRLAITIVDAFAFIQAIHIAQEEKRLKGTIDKRDPEPAIEALEEGGWQAE